MDSSVVIDWQVVVSGRFPVGWDPHSNGCWFPDFDHQEFLLPYFDVGDVPIDWCDGAVFGQADIARLAAHLEFHRGTFEAKPDNWSVIENSGESSRTLVLERDTVLSLIDRTLEMITIAQRCEGKLVFSGD